MSYACRSLDLIVPRAKCTVIVLAENEPGVCTVAMEEGKDDNDGLCEEEYLGLVSDEWSIMIGRVLTSAKMTAQSS